MSLNIEDIKKQLADAESQFEQVRATLYRLDGAIQTFKHLVAEAEKPAAAIPDSPVDPPKDN